MRKKRFFTIMSSLKTTILFLFFFLVLVFFGTIYQIDFGISASIDKFITSWFCFIYFIPFPGGQLVLSVLFINLLFAFIDKFAFSRKKVGLLILHFGILFLCFSSLWTYIVAIESYIVLKEKESVDFSFSSTLWEIACYEEKKQDAIALSDSFLDGINLLGITINVKEFYKNCDAFVGNNSNNGEKVKIENGSGLTELTQLPFLSLEKNIPGGLFSVIDNKKEIMFYLYGADTEPTKIKINDRVFIFSLRRKRYGLPYSISLSDAEKVDFEGTDIVKSYKSKLEISSNGKTRKATVSMNKPLVMGDYSFYQVSLDGDESTISVVKNSGKYLPYIASIIIIFGFIYHSLAMFFMRKKDETECAL